MSCTRVQLAAHLLILGWVPVERPWQAVGGALALALTYRPSWDVMHCIVQLPVEGAFCIFCSSHVECEKQRACGPEERLF